MSLSPVTHHVTEAELELAIAEAQALGKKDARAGVASRSPDAMPEGLEVAWDQYEEAFESELVAMANERGSN
jgi:hypothetical protein